MLSSSAGGRSGATANPAEKRPKPISVAHGQANSTSTRFFFYPATRIERGNAASQGQNQEYPGGGRAESTVKHGKPDFSPPVARTPFTWPRPTDDASTNNEEPRAKNVLTQTPPPRRHGSLSRPTALEAETRRLATRAPRRDSGCGWYRFVAVQRIKRRSIGDRSRGTGNLPTPTPPLRRRGSL